MNSAFFNTPNAAVAANFKSGSASLAREIIRAFHPDIEKRISGEHGDGTGIAYPEGKGPDQFRWHSTCPKCDPADRAITLALVREPVDRFRSACAESKITDVDAHLSEMEASISGSGNLVDPRLVPLFENRSNIRVRFLPPLQNENEIVPPWTKNVHFWPQYRLLKGNEIRLYRFPEDLEALAQFLGLAWPMVDIAGDGTPKPTLTEDQIDRVENLYAQDIELFALITGPHYLYEVPANIIAPAPIDQEKLDAEKRNMLHFTATRRYEVEVGGIVFNGIPVRTDRVDQAMINSAVAYLARNPGETIDWKTPAGFTAINLEVLEAIGNAVGRHVQSCFTREKELVEQITAAATFEDLEALRSDVVNFDLFPPVSP